MNEDDEAGRWFQINQQNNSNMPVGQAGHVGVNVGNGMYASAANANPSDVNEMMRSIEASGFIGDEQLRQAGPMLQNVLRGIISRTGWVYDAQMMGYLSQQQFQIKSQVVMNATAPLHSQIQQLQANQKPLFVWSDPPEGDNKMMDKLIRLYYAYMANDVRSPMPHLAGPPGTGKSTLVAQLAEMLEVNLYIVNVARISPLELEGVQMPVANHEVEGDIMLRLLHNPLWTNLKEGDIVLLDEFLRGFPEVYNGMLDILTSREVAGFKLPKVFFVAASNSIATYDEALRDRLLHIYVGDVRNNATAKNEAINAIVNGIGLNPEMARAQEMNDLLENEVFPMYEVLDRFKGASSLVGSPSQKGEGHSVRNLIGQALLREIQSPWLSALIEFNNRRSIQESKAQYVVLISGRRPDPKYVSLAGKLPEDRLTPIQLSNLKLNRQLIELEDAIRETSTTQEEELDDDDII